MGNSLLFTMKVHSIICKVPRGKLLAYKDIAEAMNTKAYRAVGSACKKSPGMPKCPCHRVISSDHRLHGFASGIEAKKRMLEEEGIRMKKIFYNGKTDYKVLGYENHKFSLR